MARGAPKAMGKEWTAVLADVPLFEGLSRRQLTKVANLGVARRMAPYTSIVTKGGKGDSFFVILSGKATVRRPGRRNVTLGPGDFFGEIAILRDGRRSATVTSTSPVRVLVMFGTEFRRLEAAHPEIASRIAEAMQVRVAGRVSEPA